MRTTLAVALGALALTACSGSGGNESEGTYNDVATGTRLLGADLAPSEGANPAERATRLAECSAVLTSHVSQTPPPERADRLGALADRLLRAAIALGEANGRTAADMNRVRDEAVAAHRQMAANNAAVYNSAMAQAVDRCGLAEVMTDEELAGRGLMPMSLPGNDLGPMPTN